MDKFHTETVDFSYIHTLTKKDMGWKKTIFRTRFNPLSVRQTKFSYFPPLDFSDF